mgnify:CR=1 FL=1
MMEDPPAHMHDNNSYDLSQTLPLQNIPTLQDAEKQIIFNGPAATHARLDKLGAEIFKIAYTIRDRAFALKPVDDLIISLIGAMVRVGATIKAIDPMMWAGVGLEFAVSHCFLSFQHNAHGSLQKSQWHLFRACREAISSIRMADMQVRGRPVRMAPGQRPALTVFPRDI